VYSIVLSPVVLYIAEPWFLGKDWYGGSTWHEIVWFMQDAPQNWFWYESFWVM